MDAQPNSNSIPCVICAKILDSEFLDVHDIKARWVYGGAYFYGDGNYGSRVLDEDDGSFLYLVICDECLISRSNLMLFKKRIKTNTKDIQYIIINAKEEFCRDDLPLPLMAHNHD